MYLIPAKRSFENALPWLFKFSQTNWFEKSQILGWAWPGLGPAQKRQKRQPCHFCQVTPSPDLTHTQYVSDLYLWLELDGLEADF